ncbi:RNA polymerase sigma factor [Anaerorhabdus furcosa]|uniref:RNA polymerase sigma-70 factor, ECF subfamily n=1 Tax=Anaerorhabdus furcosa TaxID=118967 RepID=A0A1T4NXH7_9FIRM|nr:sigma-70 family RNA polymerase sigma factor [Anaerorhabdus furcosa]SJZ83736.1 RNA polymerase sigma-70 factor, ECF subfamily [Anaerorhabdus furcosa]
MLSEEQVERAIDLYANDVRRLCFIYCKSEADVDDIFQNVFIKYYKLDEPFTDPTYEKAWILRVTINACKDLFKSWFRKNAELTDDFSQFSIDPKDSDGELILEVRKLRKEYATVIYLYYYEEYSLKEIAAICNASINTISSRLQRARKELKKRLGGEILNEENEAIR